jgi:hypothetical protein
MANTPMVAAVLHSNADDRHYQLYSAAYGLEMQIDDGWQAELVLFAPHEHLNAVTEDTAVTGEDTAIVSAGVTDVPLNEGEPDLSAIQHERNNWLLVAGSGSKDSEETIKAKLIAALSVGCRAILCFAELGTAQLSNRLAGIDAAKLPQLVIAYVGSNAARPSIAKNALRAAQDAIKSRFHTGAGCRFIVGGEVTVDGAFALKAIPNISGVLLEEERYSDFGDILEILGALGGSEED